MATVRCFGVGSQVGAVSASRTCSPLPPPLPVLLRGRRCVQRRFSSGPGISRPSFALQPGVGVATKHRHRPQTVQV